MSGTFLSPSSEWLRCDYVTKRKQSHCPCHKEQSRVREFLYCMRFRVHNCTKDLIFSIKILYCSSGKYMLGRPLVVGTTSSPSPRSAARSIAYYRKCNVSSVLPLWHALLLHNLSLYPPIHPSIIPYTHPDLVHNNLCCCCCFQSPPDIWVLWWYLRPTVS